MINNKPEPTLQELVANTPPKVAINQVNAKFSNKDLININGTTPVERQINKAQKYLGLTLKDYDKDNLIAKYEDNVGKGLYVVYQPLNQAELEVSPTYFSDVRSKAGEDLILLETSYSETKFWFKAWAVMRFKYQNRHEVIIIKPFGNQVETINKLSMTDYSQIFPLGTDMVIPKEKGVVYVPKPRQIKK